MPFHCKNYNNFANLRMLCCIGFGDFKKIPSKSHKLGAFFSMRNPLYRLKSLSEKTMVVVALLNFHKPGPTSLICIFYWHLESSLNPC
jgi:hypothetical protein